MFGYIAPLKSELKVREFEIYNAYYCAICHAVKSRYGQLPRLTLSYDAVFIALLAEWVSLEPGDLSLSVFRCFNNPFKKRNEAAGSPAIEYAADVMVLLGWMIMKDRKDDRDAGNLFKNIAVFVGESVLRRAGRRAVKRLGDKAYICLECYEEQRTLEAGKEPSLDGAADPTGSMMAELLNFPDIPHDMQGMLREVGYHIGRYIYIVDAIEDMDKDRKTGAYNPLLLRPAAPEALKTAVCLDLARICEIMDNLNRYNPDMVDHNSIIDNILYLGLRAKLDEVLGDGQRIRQR